MSKYPRTFHLPFSPGATSDDKILKSIDHLLGIPLVISEKFDGSNICLTSQDCFARSHSGPPTHESFDLFKSLHSSIKNDIPQGFQIFGEWLYAVHSIKYSSLPDYLLVFGVKENDIWFSWKDVCEYCKLLNLKTVPVIAEDIKFANEKQLTEFILNESKKSSLCGGDREGLVVRNSNSYIDFSNNVAKFVRANHVQTDEHWKNKIIERNNCASRI